MTLTYLDTGVLIAAFKGSDRRAIRAMEIIDDPDRAFATSIFVKLETLTKATYHKNLDELEFYEAFFSRCQCCLDGSYDILQSALSKGKQYGISGMDALHVASALELGAKTLVTTEKSTKPMHRTNDLIQVISISD